MINRTPITLNDRELFESYFKNIENSTYNFTTAFLWRGTEHITYDIISGCLVLFYEFPNRPICSSYPIGSGDKTDAVLKTCSYLKSKASNAIMRNLSTDMADELRMILPDRFEYIYDRATSDYIYETQKLISLNGKELHSKRNHYNYFIKNYNYKYRKMTTVDIAECKKLFDDWIIGKDDSAWLASSRDATIAALDNMERLNVTGGIITVDDKIVAFSIGEPVSDNMALIHLEVASPEIRGAFSAINREFCANAWNDFAYVNREEDMGLSGLRQAKQSYKPVRILDKYNAVIND